MPSKYVRSRIALGFVLALAPLGPSTPLPAAEAPPPSDAVKLVTPAVRSPYFEAVTRQLELGGTMFGYVDIDGDVEKIAGALREVLGNIAAEIPNGAMLQQDMTAIARDLGLTDVKAAGLSSVAVAGGAFRNRVYLHTPHGRHGLLAGLGGARAPLAHVDLAPADADVFFEGEMDLPAVYAALRSVVARVGGEDAARGLESSWQGAAPQIGFSPHDLIQRAKGRVTGVVRLDDRARITVPGATPLVLPGISLLLRFDGIAPVLTPLLDQAPMLKRTQEAAGTCYAMPGALPFVGWQPIIVVEGDAILVATSRAWLDLCRKHDKGLAQTPAFQKSLAELGAEGNGLLYVSPHWFTALRQIPALNPNATPETKRIFDLVMRQLPQPGYPLMSIRVNLPEGVLFRSISDHSLKQEVAMLSVYNPMTVGLMAAMAIPAFQKVRATSQAKTIQNNLRQLYAASEQFYLEHDVDHVTFEQLVGPGPDQYIRRLESVAGEEYEDIVFKRDQPLRVRTRDGREFVWPPQGDDEVESPLSANRGRTD